MIIRRAGISGRLRPSAASVPIDVAISVEKKPMMIEFLAAPTHCEFCHMSLHQDELRAASGVCIPVVRSASYQRME
ncbi:hypothetical protein D3C76_1829710 [compost metagenome]